MGLDYSSLEKIVCFRFQDYYDLNLIKSLTKKYYKENIVNEKGIKKIQLDDISVSLLIDHYIYKYLLDSNKEEDKAYIYDLCKKTLTYIINVRERLDRGYAYVKTEEEVLSYAKDNYDGKDSFIHFMTDFALGYYNGKDEEASKKEKEEYLEQERTYLDSLKIMYSCEKKLKFNL